MPFLETSFKAMAFFNNFLSLLKADLFRTFSFFLGNNILGLKARFLLLKLLGVNFKGTAKVMSGINIISLKSNLFIGDKSFINVNCFFDLNSDIQIGDNVLIGPNVSFITTSHKISKNGIKTDLLLGPIIIKNNVFIGANSVIFGGSSIGENSIIGACSLVLKNIKSNTIAFGVPAVSRKTI